MMKTILFVALFAMATATSQGVIGTFFSSMKNEALKQNITEVADMIDFPEQAVTAADMALAEAAAGCYTGSSALRAMGLADGDPKSINDIYGDLKKIVSSCTNMSTVKSVAVNLAYDAVNVAAKYASIKLCCRYKAKKVRSAIEDCISSHPVRCYVPPILEAIRGAAETAFQHFRHGKVEISSAWRMVSGWASTAINGVTECNGSGFDWLTGNVASTVKSALKGGLTAGWSGAIRGLLSEAIAGALITAASGGLGGIVVISKWGKRLLGYYWNCKGQVKAAISAISSFLWGMVMQREELTNAKSCPLTYAIGTVVNVAGCALLLKTGYNACRGPSWWDRNLMYYAGSLSVW